MVAKNDAQMNSFVNNLNTFTDELVSRVTAAPSPADGVDDAQNYMNAEQAGLKAAFDSVKNISECQLSQKVQESMSESFYRNGINVGQLQAKYGSDPAVRVKLQKLTKDFLDLFKW